jgi:hypothetical protein
MAMADERTVKKFDFDVCTKHSAVLFFGRWTSYCYLESYMREAARKYRVVLTKKEVPCDKCQEEITITPIRRKRASKNAA